MQHLKSVQPLAELLRGRNLTTFHVHPQYGRIFKLSRLGDVGVFASLREIRFLNVDNGDEALNGMLPLAASLKRIELNRLSVTHEGLRRLSRVHQLTALRLRRLHNVGKEVLQYESLKTLTKLKDFSIELCDGCTDLEFIAHLSSLESFRFVTSERSVTNLSCISILPKLKSLSLHSENSASRHKFVFSAESLTSLRVDDAAIHNLELSNLTNLESLAICTKDSRRMVEGLTGDLLSWRGMFGTSWFNRMPRILPKEEIVTISEFVRDLKSLELSQVRMTVHTLQALTSFTNLHHLRMHSCILIEDDAIDHQADAFSFPSLETWTVNSKMWHLWKYAVASMPLLDHIGIRLANEDDTLYFPMCAILLSALRLLPQLSQVSFAVAQTWEELDNGWRPFVDALSTCKTVKRIGWKSYWRGERAMPKNVVKIFEQRGIWVDEDVDIFHTWYH